MGSKLHVFIGNPSDVFQHLHSLNPIKKLSLQQDSEPIYHSRDASVKSIIVIPSFIYTHYNM